MTGGDKDLGVPVFDQLNIEPRTQCRSPKGFSDQTATLSTIQFHHISTLQHTTAYTAYSSIKPT
jgi:hypothetical protein